MDELTHQDGDLFGKDEEEDPNQSEPEEKAELPPTEEGGEEDG